MILLTGSGWVGTCDRNFFLKELQYELHLGLLYAGFFTKRLREKLAVGNDVCRDVLEVGYFWKILCARWAWFTAVVGSWYNF